MERLQQITKTRGADKYENIPKSSVEIKQKCMKNGPETQQKTMLKNRCQKIKQYFKNDSQIDPKR
jgi:hypothetical protein